MTLLFPSVAAFPENGTGVNTARANVLRRDPEQTMHWVCETVITAGAIAGL